MKTAILTDTNSGIYLEEAQRLGIFVMPMPVIINDKTYYEGVNLTEEQLMEALTSGEKVTTSQPVLGDVVDTWDKLLREYEQIVYIPMSSGLSNSCSAAKAMALEYDERVFVVDNHRISVTQRLSVMKARQLANWDIDGKEICKRLEKEAYNASIYVSVNTLEFLKKGGRITPAAATIGTVLNIRPVLSIQGEKLESFAKVRGSMKRCEEKMISACKNDLLTRFPKVQKHQVHIGAAGAGLSQQESSQWVKILEQNFPGIEVIYNPLTASITTHTGPGAVGIGITIDID
jgi:DegV family protein with EDD domain